VKKTPTIFLRNEKDRSKVTDEINPDARWVFSGEGVATRKYDGTACAIIDGALYKRREVKKGKPIPSGFIESDYDENTGKRFGWMECDPLDKADRWHFEAYDPYENRLGDGTYELVGPKVQGNPEGYENHTLVPHADAEEYPDAPRDWSGLRDWLADKDIEGLVWHHPDGRMAKIKKRDFGLERKELK